MRKYNPKKPLISLHIPKCAGLSFSEILQQWFKKRYHLHYHNEQKNIPPVKHNLYKDKAGKKYRRKICIHGHFDNHRGNGVHHYYPEAEQLITILRDPFELHLSGYFYVKKKAKIQNNKFYISGQQHVILEKNWSLEDYLREITKSYLLLFLPPGIRLDNYQEFLESNFIYIGISERLQKSVNILANKLGFRPKEVPRINFSERTESLPDGAREEFEKNNPLEMAIYRYAQSHWGNDL